MRKCPTCQAVYNDDSLKFCLNDGATLFTPQTEESTQVYNQPINTNQPINIPIAQQTIETQFRPMAQNVEQKSGGGKGLIFALVGGLAVLFILGAVGIVGWFLINSKQDDTVATVTNKNTSPTATATPNVNATSTPDETANLKQKLSELEKKNQQLQKQQQSGRDSVPITADNSTTATPKPSVVTAKANSPGDGFLALRSAPSAETGDRINKIPHGDTLKDLSCLKPAQGKKGRWCRVDNNGNLGWAFDGFMTY
ncbi:MAG: hypothetical protein MUC29_08575 [Pyrinomonadaceae bacterium]|nr:hypothetical protein [Pyrinomonadaceae bacterium]